MYLFMLINFFLFKLFVKKAKPLVKNWVDIFIISNLEKETSQAFVINMWE